MNDAWRRLAQLMEKGAKKYGENNWKKGQPLSRYLDSATSHLTSVGEGKEDEDHPIQAAWNMLAFAQTLAEIRAGVLPQALNDLGYGLPEETQLDPARAIYVHPDSGRKFARTDKEVPEWVCPHCGWVSCYRNDKKYVGTDCGGPFFARGDFGPLYFEEVV